MTLAVENRRSAVVCVAETLSAHARAKLDALPRWHWRRLVVRRRHFGPMAFVPGAREVVASLIESGFFDQEAP